MKRALLITTAVAVSPLFGAEAQLTSGYFDTPTGGANPEKGYRRAIDTNAYGGGRAMFIVLNRYGQALVISQNSAENELPLPWDESGKMCKVKLNSSGNTHRLNVGGAPECASLGYFIIY